MLRQNERFEEQPKQCQPGELTVHGGGRSSA